MLTYKLLIYLLYRLLSVEDSIAPLGTLGGRLVSNVLAATNNLVIIQAVEWKVCHLYLTAIRQLVERFPNSDNLVLALNTSYHSLVYIWSERSLGKECDLQSDEQINLLLNNIFESCTIPSDEDDVGVADEVSFNLILINLTIFQSINQIHVIFDFYKRAGRISETQLERLWNCVAVTSQQSTHHCVMSFAFWFAQCNQN